MEQQGSDAFTEYPVAHIPLARVQVPDILRTGSTIVLHGPYYQALGDREPRCGEIITLCDAGGREFRARITSLSSDSADAYVFHEMQTCTELPWRFYLLQALPDRERMELIIQKAVELGVHVIVPFKSHRSISLAEREARQPKAHRWQHIALEAAKQCRRAEVPLVAPYCGYPLVLNEARRVERKIMLWEGAQSTLKETMRQAHPRSSVAVMVGPEGGWEEEEVVQAMDAGFLPVRMGGRIIRTETAALAACAIIAHAWGPL